MFGAIIGDIVGSIYEFNNIRTKDFPLFDKRCRATDDTYMTVAVASACVEYLDDLNVFREVLINEMHRIGARYPNSGYGGRFSAWLCFQSRKPYNSYGNGSAMRVSPCGWFCDTLEDTLALAAASADVTHNHPEGIKGAQATAAAIFLARTGSSKEDIREYIETTFGYDLHRTCDEIRPDYEFNETCQRTVPEAVIAFLESTDFEDAIRNAVSLGGDSDTLAAITGSVAEAYYGIPAYICQIALSLLRLDMRQEELDIVEEFTSRFTATHCLKGEICMNYNREEWIKEVTARNAALTSEERAARLAELNAKLEAGTATDQDKDEIVSMPE